MNFPSLYEMNNPMLNNEIKYSILLPEKHKILETDCISRCDLNLHRERTSLPSEDHTANAPQKTHCFNRFRKKTVTLISKKTIKGIERWGRDLLQIHL